MKVPYDASWESLAVGRLRGNFLAMGFEFEEAPLRAYARHLYDRPDRTLLRVEGGLGIAQIHALGWDSNIYGRSIGAAGLLALDTTLTGPRRAAVAQSAARAAVDAARAAGMEMLVTRFEAAELWWAHALEDQGMRTMDVQSPLFLPTSRPHSAPVASPQFTIRDVRPEDVDELVSFAASVFSRSHLYADAALPAAASDGLHEQWVRNACGGRAWFSLVAEDDLGLCGLIAGLWDETQEAILNFGHGHIDLLAVKDDRRGRGIGLALIAASLERYATRAAEVVTISTQCTNLPAIRLYLRAGFQLAAPQVTLHGWL